MQCNIDPRGRAARLAGGLGFALAGAVILLLVAFDVLGGMWWVGAAAGLLSFGGFGIFESRAGWCALRALGVRTRI